MKMSEKLLPRIVWSMFGIVVMGLGSGFIRYAGLGTDPITGMNIGIAQTIGTSLGNWQLIINCAMLVVVIVFNRKKIGLGTFFNMVGMGYLSDFFLARIIGVLGESPLLFVQIISLIAAVLIICLSVVLYIEPNLGISPYDALAIIISERIKRPQWFRWCRIATDALCVGIGFFVGSPIGIGTVIMAFCTGPIVAFFKSVLFGGVVGATSSPTAP